MQKSNIIQQLEKAILPLQGYKPVTGNAISLGLGPIEKAFPNCIFPTGAVHEFITAAPPHNAATAGFMAGLLAGLLKTNGICIWASCTRALFPPALEIFGVSPDKVIFIDLQREKDVLWVMEEALKCEGIAAVAGEVKNIDFTVSRRLQLAVEQSRVTGLIIRNNPRNLNTTACIARWQITPLASHVGDDMPGVGFPRWQVSLLKIRNGKPGTWQVGWANGRFNIATPQKQTIWLNGMSQYGSAI